MIKALMFIYWSGFQEVSVISFSLGYVVFVILTVKKLHLFFKLLSLFFKALPDGEDNYYMFFLEKTA